MGTARTIHGFLKIYLTATLSEQGQHDAVFITPTVA